jgi:hypothetical protein
METITTGYIANIILNLLIFILLISVYSYINKLEKIGCLCSEDPNRVHIKNFSIFYLVFISIITFLPPNYIEATFGKSVSYIFAFVKFIFYIVFIIYLYIILEYTRSLINEKCKCSEDLRREFIMIGSIIEYTVLLIMLLSIVIIPLIFNSIFFLMDKGKDFEKKITSSMKKTPNFASKLASSTREKFSDLNKSIRSRSRK